MTLREEFEVWASEAPRGWKVDRLGADAKWPYQYRVWYVQNAWESWQAAHERQVALLDKVHQELQYLNPNRSTRAYLVGALAQLMHKVGRSLSRDAV